jgi:hypothetical protein
MIKLAGSAIDFYQPQAYNNDFHMPAGSVQYLQDVIAWGKPIPASTVFLGKRC